VVDIRNPTARVVDLRPFSVKNILLLRVCWSWPLC